MKLYSPDYHGFKHDNVLKKFNGTRFIGEFCIKAIDGSWANSPVAMYYSTTPDTSKEHKPYFYLFKDYHGGIMIGGMTDEEFEEVRYQSGLHCITCDNLIYSKYRHDNTSCSCGGCSIDGGRDYVKCSGENFTIINIDLLTGNPVKNYFI